MSLEAFRKAQDVMKSLQSSEQFEHFGMNSRGIRIQTGSFIEGIAGISAKNPDLFEPVTHIGGLIHKASEGYGTYVRVSQGPAAVSINVRGMQDPNLNDDCSLEELNMSMLRRSGVEIHIYPDSRSWIYANSTFLETSDGQNPSEIINKEIQQLTEEQKERLAVSLMSVVTQEVAQSGEFVDLV